MAKILVAEDDSDLRLLVSLKLESAGHQVVSVEDGSAAATRCSTMRPDLVILDLMMPGMSGLEVCRYIRADDDLKSTPVILLTARAQATDIEAGRAAGVDEYLTKPFSPRELAVRVASLLELPGDTPAQTMSKQTWLARLESGSLRRHYVAFLSLIVAGLLITAVVSAVTVIWASALVRDHADHVVELQTANREVIEIASDAYFGLHRVGTLEPANSKIRYEGTVVHLATEQRRLRDVAGGEPVLAKALERQEAAIRAWLSDYAAPMNDTVLRDEAEQAVLAQTGLDLFNEIRDANQTVDKRIDEVTTESRDRIREIMLVALAIVTLLPLLAVGGVAFLGQRLSRAVVVPLGGITRVLDQLRSGQENARAVVAGPDEVRQIAAGLNLLTEENLRASEVEADVLIQLQTIDRVRTDLVSTVSHELRTPLASIKGYLELLQDDLHDHMSPQQSSMMGAIRRNLDRLNELIANLLALSRAEETELSVQPVDLRGVATEVGTDIRLMAAGRDISIRTLHAVGPVVVLGDRSQLIRAVQNLVTNAVKFSRPGGTVELRVTDEGEHAVLEVSDEGIGIPIGDLAGLGSRFYRASNAVQAEIAGTGLGLRIVQTILDRHGGSLSVDSVEGEGSTFTLQLPLSRSVHGVLPELRQGTVREPELTRD